MIELNEVICLIRLSHVVLLLYLRSLCATLKSQMPPMSKTVTSELAPTQLSHSNCRAAYPTWKPTGPTRHAAAFQIRICSSVCSLMVKVWEMLGFGAYLRVADAWENTQHMAADGRRQLQAFSGWCAVSWRWWGCVTHSVWAVLHLSSLVLL